MKYPPQADRVFKKIKNLKNGLFFAGSLIKIRLFGFFISLKPFCS